ncbi:hypothetical protein Ddc_18523 [Ditylenchus destructor]|nr:hypothetical protein Ddc_18523 [Ditylenchus destructor]
MDVFFLLTLFTVLPYVIYGETNGCGPDWKEFQGNCYRLTENAVANTPFDSSNLLAECAKYGGKPASIHSDAENDFLAKNVCLDVADGVCYFGAPRSLKGPFLDDTPLDYDKRAHSKNVNINTFLRTFKNDTTRAEPNLHCLPCNPNHLALGHGAAGHATGLTALAYWKD